MSRHFPLLCLIAVLHPAVADAQPAAPPAAASTNGGQGASDLLRAGETAFNQGKWQAAATAFQTFLNDYAGVQGTEQAVARVKPLLGICQVRLGQFGEALPLLEQGLTRSDLNPTQRVDLLFFAALANLRTGKPAVARQQLGRIFSDGSVERGRRMEGLILGGMSYVIEQNWKESITFFEKHGGEISGYSAEAGARAKIMLLHAMMQDGQWDAAAKLASDLHAHLEETRQVVTFSSLLIQLGGHFLEANNPHQAISLLQRVPAKTEIEQLQNTRLAEAEQDLQSAEQAKNPVRSAQMQAAVAEMNRELEAFAKIPDFDSAARLRLAGAYFQLDRTREACLILDQMVRQMEPDPLVESATASLIRGWMSLERYPRAIRTADLYLERLARLPEKPNLADVMFLKAQALEGQFQYQAAADGFREVAVKFAGKPIASQADFMAAYNILQLEDYAQAAMLLDRQLKQLKPSEEMYPHVLFWRAMAAYFDQTWDDCRKLMLHYLDEAKAGGEYVDDAEFRIGYSYFAEANYPEAIRRLTKFTSANPQSEWLAEALLTLGDAQAAEGDLNDADKTYASIAVEAPGFHDEGWMKRANLLKARKDMDGMKGLLASFLEKRPSSPRIAEALQSIGWVAKQQGDLPGARRVYWDAIARFGNDSARPGIEDVFLGLQTLYPGPEKSELTAKLKAELGQAKAEKKPLHAARLGWSLARLQLTDPQTAPEFRASDARKALVALAPEMEPKDTAPIILADVADALAENGDAAQAAALYDGLRKWWPRAVERDRAYAGLGFLAAREHREKDALARFDQFEKSALMPRTPADEHGISLVEGELGGKVALARADLLAKATPDKALDILSAVQRSKATPAATRAEAFMAAARLHVSAGRGREALPYFEQVYLLFNRFPAMVAAAYYERGGALEKLGMPEKAREVYSELASREDLAAFKPFKLGLERAQALGGVIAPAEPAGGLIPPAASPR